ncbi:MAG: hypothetical protein KA419_07890 [Acidobacteria bacterium]|nr:hypothetical protein [Acidobacteriota bacterium]
MQHPAGPDMGANVVGIRVAGPIPAGYPIPRGIARGTGTGFPRVNPRGLRLGLVADRPAAVGGP